MSQAIRRQERRIGAPLFDRTSRRVALTAVGQRLRVDLQQAYDLIHHGLARATATGGVDGTLRLGVMGALGNEMRPTIDTFHALHPACEVLVTEFHFSDPFGFLRSGEADLQLMWNPVLEPDLAIGQTVFSEGRVLAVSTSSELASRESVSMEDLGDQLAPDTGPAAPDYWIEAMLPRFTPKGRPIRRSPEVRTFHEVLAQIAAGKVICPLNAHVNWYDTHPGITFVPIHDAPVTEWALVWLNTSTSPALRAFIDTADRRGQRPITPPSPLTPPEGIT